MPDKDQDKNTQKGSSGSQSDSEAQLQEELSRESSEGADSIGDVSSNRTLSGSSSWETLPDDQSTSGDSSSPRDSTPRNQ
ncbi:MAG TPA: hypothetical protein VFM77_02470 [Terriglobales bacterium]|nr:hypothetical protein [Terriglobales bacterium]